MPDHLLSIRALAKAVGRTHTNVAKNWLKHPEWPFPREGPWDAGSISQMKAWAANALSPDPNESAGTTREGNDQTNKTKAQTLLAIRRAESVKLANDKTKGLMHDSQECQRHRLRQILEVKRRLLVIPDALPFTTEDRELVRQAIFEALDEFSRG